jgi:hypothetical protein
MTNPRQIPEIPLSPEPQTPEAQEVIGFKWAAEGVGRRHKLGGVPDWLQAPDIPVCPECQVTMTFYGQLDSLGGSFCLADVGMIYVFVCFDCFTTKSVLQSARCEGGAAAEPVAADDPAAEKLE